jgi:DICT domain-containing protein
MADDELTIGQLAARTSVGVSTLRMWETRYGAPVPRRLPGGHRRYSAADVELVRDALRRREAGLSLPAALAAARAGSEAPAPVSIYAGLRAARPDLPPVVFPKRVLTALAHAIEDECCARAERPVLFASFQRERFYRAAEPRWRDFSRTARLAIVFADFPRVRRPRGAPPELPIDAAAPLAREWSLVCDAPGYTACLAAWELPAGEQRRDGDRRFETVWSAEPEVVRTATRIAWQLAAAQLDDLADPDEVLPDPSVAGPADARRVTDLANRMLGYVGAVVAPESP